MDALKERFGNLLGESIIKGIYDEDPEGALKCLEDLTNQPELPEASKERMIEDFHSQFKDELSRAEIEECLRENLFNEDSSVMALLNLVEQKNIRKKNIVFEKEKAQRNERAKKEAFDQIKQLFENVPGEEIQAILDENFGNVHDVTNILLERIKKEEEETLQVAARTRMVNDLSNFLCFDDKEKVKKTLEENGWDYEKASQQLSVEILQRKFKEYSQVYPDLDHALIIACLNDTYDDREIVAKLTEKRELKKRENAAREKEEEENRITRLRQIEEEEKERRERAKRDREVEEAKRKEEEEAFNAEQKKIAAEQRQKAEDQLKLDIEQAKKREAEEIEARKKIEKEELISRLRRDEIEAEKQIYGIAAMKSRIINIKMKTEIDREAEIANEKYHALQVQMAKSLRPEPGQLPGFIVPKPVERKPRNEDHLGSAPIKPNETLTNPHHLKSPINELSKTISGDSKLVQLKINSKTVDWGDIVILHWVHSGFATTSDWIGIFKKGEPTHTQYVEYKYVIINGDPHKGSISMNAPHLSGEYEFRYFNYGNYSLYGVSETLKVGPQFEIFPEMVNETMIKVKIVQQSPSIKSFKTWIGIYTSETLLHSEYSAFEWITPDTPVNFPIPKCGKWYFRLFTNISRYDFCCSAEIFIEGKDSITLEQTSDSLVVNYDLKSVDSNNDRPWIGIYRKGETLSNMYEQYIYIPQAKGASRMKILRPGEWEARLHSNVQENYISKSNILLIP